MFLGQVTDVVTRLIHNWLWVTLYGYPLFLFLVLAVCEIIFFHFICGDGILTDSSYFFIVFFSVVILGVNRTFFIVGTAVTRDEWAVSVFRTAFRCTSW